MSEEIWKIEKNLCRCCHAEGDFDNLAEPRVYLEQEEIYFNMLRECFNIEIPPVPGELCTMTYSICEVCILRLQDASSFKKQVQHSEERFMALYCNNSVKVLNSKKPLIKLENSESDTDYNEDFIGLNDENDEEYKIDIKHNEDNPNSDEDRYLTLKKGKTKIKPKSHKSKHTPKIREDVKKTKSSVKEKKVLNSKKPLIKLENSESDTDYNEDFIGLNDENDEEYKIDIKHNEDNPNSDEDRYLTLKKGKTKIKPKSHKSKHTPIMREDVKKTKNSVKEKKGETPTFRLQAKDYKLDGKTMACSHCDKKYGKKSSLRFHIKSKHYRIPKYKCPACVEEFMTIAPFTVHKLEEHQIDDRIHCNACRAMFNSKVQLRKHINIFHMMGEKFKCEVCDYESFSFEGLYKHKFKHKTSKDHHCSFCEKSFLRKTTLDLHERIHTGDRRKVCQVCSQAFVQKASLNYHMTKYHPEVNF